jgi:hypothetical protein
MARNTVGLGLVGLFVVFLAVLYFIPMLKRFFPTVSGFQDIPTDLTCQPGLKPCPEGYFCEQNTCVPILPRYNINNVRPNSDGY